MARRCCVAIIEILTTAMPPTTDCERAKQASTDEAERRYKEEGAAANGAQLKANSAAAVLEEAEQRRADALAELMEVACADEQRLQYEEACVAENSARKKLHAAELVLAEAEWRKKNAKAELQELCSKGQQRITMFATTTATSPISATPLTPTSSTRKRQNMALNKKRTTGDKNKKNPVYRVGQAVEREFRAGVFRGEIFRVPGPNYPWYFVVYEDNDTQTFAPNEISKYVVEDEIGDGDEDYSSAAGGRNDSRKRKSASAAASSAVPGRHKSKRKRKSPPPSSSVAAKESPQDAPKTPRRGRRDGPPAAVVSPPPPRVKVEGSDDGDAKPTGRNATIKQENNGGDSDGADASGPCPADEKQAGGNRTITQESSGEDDDNAEAQEPIPAGERPAAGGRAIKEEESDEEIAIKEEDNDEDGNVGDSGEPGWVQGMRHFLLHVPHGSKKAVCSPKNASSVMHQVKQLASGLGVGYGHWPEGVKFAEGRRISIEDDNVSFGALLREAKAFQGRYGRDKGRGWLLTHPLRKMELYRSYRRKLKKGG